MFDLPRFAFPIKLVCFENPKGIKIKYLLLRVFLKNLFVLPISTQG